MAPNMFCAFYFHFENCLYLVLHRKKNPAAAGFCSMLPNNVGWSVLLAMAKNEDLQKSFDKKKKGKFNVGTCLLQRVKRAASTLISALVEGVQLKRWPDWSPLHKNRRQSVFFFSMDDRKTETNSEGVCVCKMGTLTEEFLLRKKKTASLESIENLRSVLSHADFWQQKEMTRSWEKRSRSLAHIESISIYVWRAKAFIETPAEIATVIAWTRWTFCVCCCTARLKAERHKWRMWVTLPPTMDGSVVST